MTWLPSEDVPVFNIGGRSPIVWSSLCWTKFKRRLWRLSARSQRIQTKMNSRRSLRSYHRRRYGDWMISHKGHQKWRKCLEVSSAWILVRKEKRSCQWLRDGAGVGKSDCYYVKLRVNQLLGTDEQIEVDVSAERILHHCPLSKARSKFT